jgi:multimeric flavodoxin WrbA
MAKAQKRLLIVYHSRTGGTRQMVQALARAARQEGGRAGLTVQQRAAARATPADLLQADALVLAAPENLAAMSGPMKDFFDRCYYPALDRLQGRPYACLVCAGTDGSSAVRQIERICTGWRLRAVAPALIVHTGAQTPEHILAPKQLAAAELARCAELGSALAAGLLLGIF